MNYLSDNWVVWKNIIEDQYMSNPDERKHSFKAASTKIDHKLSYDEKRRALLELTEV